MKLILNSLCAILLYSQLTKASTIDRARRRRNNNNNPSIKNSQDHTIRSELTKNTKRKRRNIEDIRVAGLKVPNSHYKKELTEQIQKENGENPNINTNSNRNIHVSNVNHITSNSDGASNNKSNSQANNQQTKKSTSSHHNIKAASRISNFKNNQKQEDSRPDRNSRINKNQDEIEKHLNSINPLIINIEDDSTTQDSQEKVQSNKNTNEHDVADDPEESGTGEGFYVQHTTNIQCLNDFCHSECQNINRYESNPACFNCIRFNGCTQRGSESWSYKSCGQTECANECVLDRSIYEKDEDMTIVKFKKMQSDYWNSKKCSVCMAKACVKHEVDNISNANEQCTRKCKILNSCDSHNGPAEKSFKQCSSNCHINYDNIKEARQCVNNLCNQHIKPSCRSCLDICVVETLVLGYYKIPNIKLIKESLQMKKEKEEFINSVLPSYQVEVEYEEKAKFNGEVIDYNGLDQFDDGFVDENNTNNDDDYSDYTYDSQQNNNDDTKILNDDQGNNIAGKLQFRSVNNISQNNEPEDTTDDNLMNKLRLLKNANLNRDQIKDALALLIRDDLPKSRLQMYAKARLQMQKTLGRK